MDDRRVGRIFREVRIHLRWRQSDVSDRARVSQRTVSQIELGRLESVSLVTIRRVAAVLDIRVAVDAWWRAGRSDSLLDRAHAALVEHVVTELRDAGWTVRVEVTFNEFGERGSADVVGWHPEAQVLLIAEIKSRLDDLQDTAATFERKVRVVPAVLEREEGWRPATVGRLLVVADTRANRDVVARHRATFGAIWPERTAAIRRWIHGPGHRLPDRTPRGPGGIWFLPMRRAGAVATSVVRMRRRTATVRPGSGSDRLAVTMPVAPARRPRPP